MEKEKWEIPNPNRLTCRWEKAWQNPNPALNARVTLLGIEALSGPSCCPSRIRRGFNERYEPLHTAHYERPNRSAGQLSDVLREAPLTDD